MDYFLCKVDELRYCWLVLEHVRKPAFTCTEVGSHLGQEWQSEPFMVAVPCLLPPKLGRVGRHHCFCLTNRHQTWQHSMTRSVQQPCRHRMACQLQAHMHKMREIECMFVSQGMEGATLGVWCAHGEGQAHFPDQSVLQKVESQSLAPIRCPSYPPTPPHITPPSHHHHHDHHLIMLALLSQQAANGRVWNPAAGNKPQRGVAQVQ